MRPASRRRWRAPQRWAKTRRNRVANSQRNQVANSQRNQVAKTQRNQVANSQRNPQPLRFPETPLDRDSYR